MKNFIHLHVHSCYSVGDAIGSVREYINMAVAEGMKGMALTDNGTLAGIPELFCYTKFINKNREKEDFFKPIAGCVFEVCIKESFSDILRTPMSRLIVLAKNLTGYRNLVRLVNESYKNYIEGPYVIKKSQLKQYHEGLIVLSNFVLGEISLAIVNDEIESAKSAIWFYKNIFGEDFYLELMRQKDSENDIWANYTTNSRYLYQEQKKVNDAMISLSKECGIKLVATNGCHFPADENIEDNDTFVCKMQGKDKRKRQCNRDRKYSRQQWMKSQEEMNDLFSDIPESIDNTMEIWNKCELYEIKRKPEFPNVSVPTGYKDADDYLAFLTHDGATRIYGTPIPETVADRIDFELDIIKKKGYANYFLFWHDVIRAVREELDLWTGAGRGSSCGSIVNYCLGITKIDPLKYDLLFTRFINPERTVLPDIEIDVEDGGKEKVFEYIRKKYGEYCCANIISYSKNKAGNIINGKNDHVCGLIVSKNPTSDYVPLERIPTNDDKELVFVSQYDGFYVEDMGVVKVDIQNCDFLKKMRAIVKAVEKEYEIQLDIDNIPINDTRTLTLFKSAKTDDIPSFSSEEMQFMLNWMWPENFNDLILLNTLEHPSIDYNIEMVHRKNGINTFHYEIPDMVKMLGESYGLIVYQEQVMQLSQMIAGFSHAEADNFRKDLGNIRRIKEWKEKFVKGGLNNGHDKQVLYRVWEELNTMGVTALNKSHILAYTFMSYQMAYLKAHYPREFFVCYRQRGNQRLRSYKKKL